MNAIEIMSYRFDLKILVKKCFTFAQRNLNKLFTIILHSTKERLKNLPKELPPNIRLFIHVEEEELDQ